MKDILTIGYEGASVPRFLDALREAGVELLVDVRALASSRRPGFAKTALAANLVSAGIDYLHLRKLGTPAEGRAAARAGRTSEMQRIFREQLATDEAQGQLAEVDAIVREGKQVCLLCFEAEAVECHRAIVADALSRRTGAQVRNLAPWPEDDAD
jgi:uncharacterized protein (DUF488 family)